MNIRSSILGLCVGATLLAGCTKYRPTPLQKHTITTTKTTEENQELLVQASVLSEVESKQAFSNRSPQAKGYMPIHLVITNNTKNAYTLYANNIDLEIASPETVAHQIGYKTANRVAGWAVAGFFVWPFLIPALVEGLKSSKANKELRRDLDTRAIGTSSKIKIPSFSVVDRVIFVANENYKTTFDAEFTNKETDSTEQITVNIK